MERTVVRLIEAIVKFSTQQTPQRVLVTRFVSIETLLKQLPPFSRDKQEVGERSLLLKLYVVMHACVCVQARKVLQQLLAHFQQVCESQDQKVSLVCLMA